MDTQHTFLCHSPDPATAATRVRRFMANTELINYEEVVVRQEEIIGAGSPDFWPCLTRLLARNEEFCHLILAEIKASGATSLDDLLALEPGYPSKLLHILSHMVDGFIGIDSAFYNLVDDSHRLSEAMAARIKEAPHNFWLVPVRTSALAQAVLHR
ncbi:MAG: hypothetical protein ABFR97_10095 [Thermodesulfobacteriota bacterium]